MNAVTAFFFGLREAFTLREAERAAIADGDERRAEARKLAAAARARRSAARKTMTPPPAVTLLREALVLAIASERATRGEDTASIDLAKEVDAEGPIAAWAGSTSRTYVDDLEFADAEALRDALDALVTRRLSLTDTRSVLAIRALRYGRFIALSLAIACTLFAIARATFLVHDVALGKPVITNGLHPESPPNGEGVVDGRTRGTFGVFTAQSAHPFVMIDLEKEYAISSIRIFNRGDGWFDDGLPLVVEVSTDGIRFTEVGRRTTHYDKWAFALPAGTQGRWVRVSKATPGELALNEIEVYARE